MSRQACQEHNKQLTFRVKGCVNGCQTSNGRQNMPCEAPYYNKFFVSCPHLDATNGISHVLIKLLSLCLLQETVCLQWLVLSYNDIGPAGGEAIAKGLQASYAYYSTVTDLILFTGASMDCFKQVADTLLHGWCNIIFKL